MFCGRKHFPLFSSEAASSLDSGGSLEGASLPAENKAKDQLEGYTQVLSMDWRFLPRARGLAQTRALRAVVSPLPCNYFVASCYHRPAVYAISILQQSGCTPFTKHSHPEVNPSSRVQSTDGAPGVRSLRRAFWL